MISNQTIFITGGSSGIGLELGGRLSANNDVIICGSNSQKLAAAKTKFPKLVTYTCDLADAQQVEKMIDQIKNNHPALSILINNAAIVHNEPFIGGETMLAKAEKEMAVNFLAPLRLIQGLHEVLIKNNAPQIINITTGLVYSPRKEYSFYNSTKAALHSFTQVLRMQNLHPKLHIREVLFPVVDTPWHKGKPPKIAITAKAAVDEMLQLLETNKDELRIGKVKLLYYLNRIAPGFALKKLNNLSR